MLTVLADQLRRESPIRTCLSECLLAGLYETSPTNVETPGDFDLQAQQVGGVTQDYFQCNVKVTL